MQNEFDICGTAYDLFFCSCVIRPMSIKINDSYSKVHHLCFCVAQGSVLGPALFNTYKRYLKMKGLKLKVLHVISKSIHRLHICLNIIVQ